MPHRHNRVSSMKYDLWSAPLKFSCNFLVGKSQFNSCTYELDAAQPVFTAVRGND